MSEDLELSNRISALEKHIDGLYSLLRKASKFSSSEPHISLNQCRVILERLLYDWYQIETHKVMERPMLGSMLNDKEFHQKIPRNILPKITYIKDYGNLGTHGEEIDSKIAEDVVHKLLDVLEWFTTNPNTENVLSQSKARIGRTMYVEILPQLKKEYPKCLDPDIEFVRFGQDEKVCYLEIIFNKLNRSNGSQDTMSDISDVYHIYRDVLDYIGERNYETGELILEFDPKNSLNENARKFISNLGVIVSVTELFTYEAANKLIKYSRKHGKYPVLKQGNKKSMTATTTEFSE